MSDTLRAFAIPCASTLLLCLSTMGSHVFWQDSGFYLSSVRALGVLYPHGFVLYEFTCWAWTKLLFFVDFTRAVYLYSAVCAAAAAGVLALTARDLLRARHRVLAVVGEAGPHASACGIVSGVLAGAGYTFWSSGFMAKGYALYFLILALLLWRMIAAIERNRPADWTAAAALIGLAWAGHPSATLAGLGMLGFAAFGPRSVGWKGLAWRTALAAFLAAGPTLLTPILARRAVECSMDDPTTASDLFRYFVGARYMGGDRPFAYEPARMSTLASYFWEELLGVGAVLALLGLAKLTRANRAMLGWIAAWSVPYLAVAVLFRIEGQQDFWYVAAWMPLYPILAVGLHTLVSRTPRHARWIIASAGVVGLAWSVAANYRDLDQRGYGWAEAYGRYYLKSVDPHGVVLCSGDDLKAICQYLRTVRGERTDVAMVWVAYLAHRGSDGRSAYEDRMRRAHPGLLFPDPSRPSSRGSHASIAAEFLKANAGSGRPLYVTNPLPPELWPEGWEFEPAGPLLKLVPKGTAKLDPRHMAFPLAAEEIPSLFRRPRAILLLKSGDVLEIGFQPYERHLLTAQLIARQHVADWHLRRGGLEPAVRLYESILRTDPFWRWQHLVLFQLGQCALALGRDAQAQETLEAVLSHSNAPALRCGALLGLGDLARRTGRESEARARYEEAARLEGLSPELLRETQIRLSNPRPR